MGYETPSDVMDEIADADAALRRASATSASGRGGLQWPVAADGTDSPILYEDEFALPGGRAQFAALPYKPPGDAADDEFPLILVTGRRLEHYNAGTMTRRTGNLDLMPSDWLEMHPDDAASLGSRRATASRVRSRRGEIELPVRLTERIERGPRVHRLPLPGGAHQPADRPVGRREHLVPGVQGGGGVGRARR